MIGKVRAINHCITYPYSTEGEPELRRGKIDEKFFFNEL